LETLNHITIFIGFVAFSDTPDALKHLYSLLPEAHTLILEIIDIQFQEYLHIKKVV
jgi:hypothetical protein